jgi:autotransporter-associated beta strand protein
VQLGGQRLALSTNASTSFDGVLLGIGQSRLEKRGSGTLTLSNAMSSFSGGTTVTDGAVSVPYLRNAGINSPLGSAGPISLGDAVNNGRLVITSAVPGATNRPIVLGDAGGTIEVSDPGAEVVLTGSVSGTGTLLKLGLGRMRFASQFGGPIVVANGTFAPAADVPGPVTAINPGRVESINGVNHHLGALVLAGGIAAPGGNGIAGALQAGQLSTDGGVFELDLISAATGDYDQIALTGAAELLGSLELTINLKFNPVDRVDVFRIVTSGSPTIFAEPDALVSYQGKHLADGDEFLVNSGGFSQFFGIRYDPNGESGIELFAAPEPGTASLLLAGLACAAGRLRRRYC